MQLPPDEAVDEIDVIDMSKTSLSESQAGK
jgi:hypothetical protein